MVEFPTQVEQDRFWAKVVKQPEGCWIWEGCRLKGKSYGQLTFHTKRVYAHRFSYWLANNYLPTPNEYVCHQCDNPVCVNPNHLWLGDALSNTRDMYEKGRNGLIPKLGHCQKGLHEMAEDNRDSAGLCKQCRRERDRRKYRERRKAIQS